MTPFQTGFTIFTVGSVPLLSTLYYGVRKCQRTNLSYDSEPPTLSWGDLANLTHETQVATFGWCPCEDSDTTTYDDCPKGDNE